MCNQLWEQQLQTVTETCANLNWDGYGALPVNVGSLNHARTFLQMIEPSESAPEISVDPDGEVSVSWYGDSGNVFSVSVGEAGRLACAYLSTTYEFSWIWYLTDGGFAFNE